MFAIDGLTVLLIAGISAACYAFGATRARRTAYTDAVRDHGLTPHTADLYARAANLFTRLAALADLDGVLAGDNLSPSTRKQVDDWLADYRKGLTKP